MKCRICNSNQVRELGLYKPYSDYECIVYECLSCESRFVKYDQSIYEKLHSLRNSSYLAHEELAHHVSQLVAKNKINQLKSILRENGKFRFIIDSIEKEKNINNILEIGCSKGYLTAYFLAKKYQILGVDIAPSAIKIASQLFGNHFCTPDSSLIETQKPYDAIYHVGTIGCVESPVAITRQMLSLIRSEGILLFNSPNVAACQQSNQIWVKGTSPPDLVTLFSSKFWQEYFNDIARVEIIYEKMDVATKIKTYLQPNILTTNNTQKLFAESNISKNKINLRQIKKIFNNTLLNNLLPEYISEFGMYIIMRKK